MTFERDKSYPHALARDGTWWRSTTNIDHHPVRLCATHTNMWVANYRGLEASAFLPSDAIDILAGYISDIAGKLKDVRQQTEAT
jgi:hypothetical protein